MSGDPILNRARKQRLGVAVAVLAAAILALWIQQELRPVKRAIRALRSRESAVRLAATAALGGAEADDAPLAMSALAEALGDADDQVRIAAASRLGSVGVVAMMDTRTRGSVRTAVEALCRAVADRRPEVRAAAAFSLAQLPAVAPHRTDPAFDYGPVADVLARGMGDPSVAVRAAARRALSTLAAQTAIAPPPALLANLGPAVSADLRKEAMSVLPAFRPRFTEVIPLLVEALSDPDPSVRYGAAGALGAAGSAARSAIPALIALLKEPVGSRPATADLSPGSSLPAEIPPDRSDPACEAARALGLIAPGAGADAVHEAVAALSRTLRSEHGWRRNAAAHGLFLIGTDAAAAAPALIMALIESITSDGNGQKANSWAARALGLAAPGTAAEVDAIAALTRALDSSGQGTRAYSADSLARFGSLASSALPRLRALREDRDRFVSSMAVSAIARLEAASARVSPTEH